MTPVIPVMFAHIHNLIFVHLRAAILAETGLVLLWKLLCKQYSVQIGHLLIFSFFAGSKNPKITLKLAEFKSDSKGKVSDNSPEWEC